MYIPLYKNCILTTRWALDYSIRVFLQLTADGGLMCNYSTSWGQIEHGILDNPIGLLRHSVKSSIIGAESLFEFPCIHLPDQLLNIHFFLTFDSWNSAGQQQFFTKKLCTLLRQRIDNIQSSSS